MGVHFKSLRNDCLLFYKCFNLCLALICSWLVFFFGFSLTLVLNPSKAKVVTFTKIRIFAKLINFKLQAWRHAKKWLRCGNIYGKLIDISYHINIWEYSSMMVLSIKIYNFFMTIFIIIVPFFLKLELPLKVLV